MTASLATKQKATTIARPLKVLVPLIKDELVAGDRAGLEHYRRAGEMLLEAKEQMVYGNFGRWLSTNFGLSRRTAYHYMALAERIGKAPEVVHRGAQPPSMREVIGRKPDRHAWQPAFKAAEKLDADLFAQERQARDDEIQLHRDLALELVNLGYRALATRLHPDRGGSKDAMARLNRVRDELKAVAETRRFV